MCGIAGWFGELLDDRQQGKLLGSLHHRGPDSRGAKVWDGAGLLHTRLSILDLSPTGQQPMSNEDGTIWVVFNGEIYNHQGLRKELEAKGHRFQGRSDTEVLPHLYEEEGRGFLKRLRGMFAFALYDSRRKVLLLARDRFGIKPLFYAHTNRRLVFSSEINSLRVISGVDQSVDPQAVSDFAGLNFVPAPLTWYKGIRALEPRQSLEAGWEKEAVVCQTRLYHAFSLNPDENLELEQAVERTEGLLKSAVRRQLESDVALGSLLSGGIDSSLVSEAAQEASGGLHTFNVRFPDPDYDETWAAEAVARSIGSIHRTLPLREAQGTWDQITGLLAACGQPFADTSIFAVHEVCREMRKYVTVALSGDGGDEAFGGYSHYWRLKRIANWLKMPGWLLAVISSTSRLPSRVGLTSGYYAQRLRSIAGADDTGVIQGMFSMRDVQTHRRLVRHSDSMLPLRRHFEALWIHGLPGNASRAERLAALATEVDIRLILPNDFLFKVDTASMRCSLEVRVPMLDEDLFDFGLQLPYRLKTRGRQCKRVLRGVARRRLPDSVARKKKMGFGVPVDSWTSTDFKMRLKETVLAKNSPLSEYLDPGVYGPWLKAFAAGGSLPGMSRAGLYQNAIMLLSAHLFLTRKPDGT